MKKKKLVIPVLILFIVLIVLLIVAKKAGWIGKEFALSVTTQKAEEKTIVEYIGASGKVQPKMEVKISPDVSGEIIELFVAEGDRVSAGDPLCVIKPDLYISSLNRAEAALNTAKARQSQAEARQIEQDLAFKRARQLFDSGTIPVSDYEASEAAYQVAKAEVEAAQFSVKSAEASVEEAREQLTKTRIYAPVAGTVSALNVEKGERVVGTNMYAGTEMMVIADLGVMEVQAEVNENNIVKVSLNDTALIEVDAYLHVKLKGVVTEIANSAKVTGSAIDQVTNFDVKILLLPESYAGLIDSTSRNYYPLRPGMSATVDILTHRRENVISVPIGAVTTRTSATKTKDSTNRSNLALPTSDKRVEVVFVHADGRARQVEVKTGIQDNTSIEIAEGLTIGDEVIVAPYNAISKTLSDSMAVRVVTDEQLFETPK